MTTKQSEQYKIETRIESKRGCGFRKPGGMYLMAGSEGHPCGHMPVPLNICPCCGGGIKFNRAFTWLEIDPIIQDWKGYGNSECENVYCAQCPANGNYGQKVGLLWIGEKYYKTAGAFLDEAKWMGISRRIRFIPHGFKLGETWVAMAHIKALKHTEVNAETNKLETVHTPGIFQFFKPESIEYVVKGTETPEELQRLHDRGITLVDVKPVEKQNSLDLVDLPFKPQEETPIPMPKKKAKI